EDGGKLIARCDNFKTLVQHTFQSLQKRFEAKHFHSEPKPEDVQKFARTEGDHLLKDRRAKQGLAFRDHGANPVIGGVGAVQVKDATAAVSSREHGQVIYDVVLQANFADTYDFENKRTCAYDAFRKRLAAMLRHKQFAQFIELVHASEFSPPPGLSRG